MGELEKVEEVEEAEWKEGGVVADIVIDGMADMELVITGPHEPSVVVKRDLHVEYMAYNR